jgi:hypothetical protein
MLTIARNLAIGSGPSVEAGATLTNGTQPLMTGVYAALFWIVGGNKGWGVWCVQILGVAISLLSALLLYRIGLILFAKDQRRNSLAAVSAAAWYVAPLGTRYGQNCLETGAASLLPLVIGLFFLRHELGPKQPWPFRRCLQLGALLALAFWIRNDAVLLSAAVCATLVFSVSRTSQVKVGRRIAEAGCIGGAALLMVSPWLIYNYALFGHIVPISGISQGADSLGENLARLPSILAEQLSIVALVPVSWETQPVVLVTTSLLVFGWIGLAYRETRTLPSRQRYWLRVLSVWAALLIGFYGLAYGAGYFMGRYLFPLSPWAAALSVWLAHRLWARAGSPRPRLVLGLALSAMIIMSVGVDVRAYRKGMNNGHFQVVEWVQEHVPEDVWVGAIQTGTLGFFHDRTYNLDGKVSPPALAARFEGRIYEYILERPIRYLVDWVGIASWLEDPRLGRHFELVLVDESRNLAVLRRLDTSESHSN